jgi:Protein of unknown function (DUF1553)/Protein of unknown function (DUF1549)/Planctomycete cytochrome C/Concanavalin A-like lectin/glucanases superfamily
LFKLRPLFALSALFAVVSAAQAATGPTVDFQRQVRPILSDKCFLCHGPDKGTRMADLRLDTKDGAMAKRKNGYPIVPGNPDESLLIKRIYSDNPAFRMPPTFSHRTLTQDQKDTLRRWIEQGATWKQHWAFIAPVKATPPVVKETSWPRNDIDRFILARMESSGLQPAPEADRRTLIRRVTLDLTGLPPTPEEVDAFVNDKSPDAYEKVVDRLLASPHYGEHRARYWLDAARYADTQGFHFDNYREMWPYRDWVIKAFNKNMPFDRFTVEQLGGDLLPNATLDQKIASGFQRCLETTNEGGVILPEWEAIYAKDRADTTGTVWLGLTVGCATCHDHKFDPISQKDYYSLTSFFRNTTQTTMDMNIPNTPPVVYVPPDADRQRWDELNARRATLEKQLADEREKAVGDISKWLSSSKRRSAAAAYAEPGQQLHLAVGSEAEVTHLKARQTVNLSPGTSIIDAPPADAKALHFAKGAKVQLPNVAGVHADRPFTIASWIYIPKSKEGGPVANQYDEVKGEKTGEVTRRGWRMAVEAGNLNLYPHAPALYLMGEDGKTLSARPAPQFDLKQDAWYHVVFTYDGSRSDRGFTIYINGAPVMAIGRGEELNALQSSTESTAPLTLGSEGKESFENGAVTDFRILNRMVDPEEAQLLYLSSRLEAAAKKAPNQLSDAEREALAVYYTEVADKHTRRTVAELHEADKEWLAIRRRSATTFVMQERTDQKPVAHVLYRGQYDQMRDEVTPNTPSVLPPMTQSMARNRLGLAMWIVDPSNPLTARVTVNRFWEEVFGTGIVKTVEDFGSQGEPPSHPELLDWLAVDFRDSGWDVKRLFKMMVMSATYQQSAETTPGKIAKDPDNRLLARGPHFRMDGEMVRDYALAASGLLRPEIGGPSVKPYQPDHIWDAVAMVDSNTRFYQQDHGDALYRRSLYTFWKRAAPAPSMDIFNAPTRESCTVRRERTNTPLQALVTMNDTQFVEAARVLAQSALHASPQFDGEVNFMAGRLLARPLEPKELDVLNRSYRDLLAHYSADTADAGKLLAVGESKADPKLAKPQFAAMTMVANEMMNLDEVLVK